MSDLIRFNTGRMYTSAGQRITARLMEDGTVEFADHDRMIYYVTKNTVPDYWDQLSVSSKAAWIMAQYDGYSCRMSSSAMSIKCGEDHEFVKLRI